jgi:hypothetical protein
LKKIISILLILFIFLIFYMYPVRTGLKSSPFDLSGVKSGEIFGEQEKNPFHASGFILAFSRQNIQNKIGRTEIPPSAHIVISIYPPKIKSKILPRFFFPSKTSGLYNSVKPHCPQETAMNTLC